jgi:hypothetical protein
MIISGESTAIGLSRRRLIERFVIADRFQVLEVTELGKDIFSLLGSLHELLPMTLDLNWRSNNSNRTRNQSACECIALNGTEKLRMRQWTLSLMSYGFLINSSSHL